MSFDANGICFCGEWPAGEAGTEEAPIVLSFESESCAMPFCDTEARTRHFACGHLLCRRCYAGVMDAALTRDATVGVAAPTCPICRGSRVINEPRVDNA